MVGQINPGQQGGQLGNEVHGLDNYMDGIIPIRCFQLNQKPSHGSLAIPARPALPL